MIEKCYIRVLDYLENKIELYNKYIMHLVIVFDLDKTIGYFEQLGIIVDLIKKHKREV